MSPLSSDVQLDCDVCLSLIERHRLEGTFFLLGKWYYMRHPKTKERRRGMREMWVTVGAMVLGYLMYLGIKSMGRK